jgi:Flp pilus assembly pilin Flp
MVQSVLAPARQRRTVSRLPLAELLKEKHMLPTFVWIQTRSAVRDERGQTMAEYGVLLAVITLVVVAGLMALSDGLNGALEEVAGIF